MFVLLPIHGNVQQFQDGKMSAITEQALGLSYGAPYGDTPWNVWMDSNFVKLGACAQISVQSMSQISPPGTAVDGARYIVASGATGKLAITVGTAYEFYTVLTGWVIWDSSSSKLWVYNGTGYTDVSGGTTPTVTTPIEKFSIPWFAPSANVVVSAETGQPAGDPFIVWDASSSVFRMFYFRAPSAAQVYSINSTTLEGPWSAETSISSLTNYHKLCILVDAYRNPVQISGLYHAYAVYYNGSLSSKSVWHFTATSLSGAWTLGSNVVPPGASGTWDGYSTDAPFALYDSDTNLIYLWYMAAPDVSQSDFGYATRMMLATSSLSNPDGPFTKNYSTAVITPSSNSADWDYGWIGGMQVLKLGENQPYTMIFNAGNTRPSGSGLEPNTSLIGAAWSNTLTGPWTSFSYNPITSLSNIPNTAVENTNIWRGHCTYDHNFKKWYLFYNTGYAAGAGELVTYCRQDCYMNQYYPNPTGGGDILTLTTSEQQVPNSMFPVWPGLYSVTTLVNVIGDTAGSTPKINVTGYLRFNGSVHYDDTVQFIGNYAYENDDIILKWLVPVTSTGYIDMSLQVTNGSPATGTVARNLRIEANRSTN